LACFVLILNLKMSEISGKFYSIELLKVDIKLGPIEDKIEQLFTLNFRLKEEESFTWEVNHRFAKFEALHKQIVHALSNFISTEFPKTHRSRAALGFKISDEKLEDRRKMLNLWLREVIASYDLLPTEIQASLMDFIRIPSCFSISFDQQIKSDELASEALSPIPEDSSSLRVNVGATPGSARSSFSEKSLIDNVTQASSPRTVVPSPTHVECVPVKMSSLFLNVHELVEAVVDATAFLHTSTGINGVMCISRSEHVTTSSTVPVGRAFLSDLFSSYGFLPWLTVVTVILFCSDYSSVRFPLTLIGVSLVALACTWYHDQHIIHTRNLVLAKQHQLKSHRRNSKTPTGPLQAAVTDFMPPHQPVSYSEFIAPAPGCEKPKPVVNSRVDVSKVVSPIQTDVVAVEVTSSSQKGALIDRQESNLSATSVTSAISSTSTGPLSAKEIAELKKKRVLAARKAFDEFEFDDLSPAARAMFVDRRYTHAFQVRGPKYLDDKKKVHPGSAMCKLMLLELYEVEAKDGDRHDHVASRGLAKQRREAISALPGNPFVIVANFQIPGDPPVSIHFVYLFDVILNSFGCPDQHRDVLRVAARPGGPLRRGRD
jgi:hypothetical protein